MTRSLSKIDERAARLIVSIVETEKARIAGAVLSDYYAASAAPLIGAGLLVPDGPVPAATSLTDHDDEPVSLQWSPEHQAYGYFSPAAGWVTVEEKRLQVYRIDPLALLQRLAAGLICRSRLGRLNAFPASYGSWAMSDCLDAEAGSRSGLRGG